MKQKPEVRENTRESALLCGEELASDHLLQKMKQKPEVRENTRESARDLIAGCKFSYKTAVPLHVAVADGLRIFTGCYNSG
jgi:hypothetical protein